ncbi:hypothetical protein LT330_002035 [Penicillium expansum]|nr:hypothetical protein LT330_002035 [Penicillium expansum]
MNADIEYIEYDPGNKQERSQYWRSSNLNWAVQNGDEEIVDALLAHLDQMKVEIPGLTVESVDPALYSAAHGGYFTIVKTLIGLTPDAVRPDDYYDRVLSYALGEEDYWYNERYCSCTKQDVDSGSRKKPLKDHYAIVKLLLDHGAHCNYTGSYFLSCMPVLLTLFKCSSISNGVLKLLVERGADVSIKEVLRGFIETTNRCVFSNEETAKFLLDHGAGSSALDYISTTVLNDNNKKGLIELLVAFRLPLNRINGWSEITKTFKGRAKLMKQLLDLDASTKYRTAFQSVNSDTSNPWGCDFHKDNSKGLDQFRGPISELEPEKPDYETCVSFIYDSMRLLLSYGAVGDIIDSEEQTPLYNTDNKHLVKLILAHGADVNEVDLYGQTPLHVMTYGASKSMVGTIKLLLKHGADITAKNADNNTSLHLAVLTSAWEVVQLLLDHGADRNIRNSDGETPMDLLARRKRHKKEFSFNKNKKGDLMSFRYQKFVDVHWRGWETFRSRVHHYYH